MKEPIIVDNGLRVNEAELLSRPDIQKSERLIRRLAAAGLFGKVTFSLQAGKIVDARLEQTLKPDEF